MYEDDYSTSNNMVVLHPPCTMDKPGKAAKSTTKRTDRQKPFLLWLNNVYKPKWSCSRGGFDSHDMESDDEMQELKMVAYDFLNNGSPYKGFVPFIPTHLYQHFESESKYSPKYGRVVQSRQRSYSLHCVNMLKEQHLAQWDRDSTSWTVANETALEQVLSLYKHNHDAPVWVPIAIDKKNISYTVAWKTDYVMQRALVLKVLEMLKEWDEYNQELQRAAKHEKEMKIEARKRLESVYRTSSTDEIDELKRKYGLTWDDQLDKACDRSRCIGLSTTMSNCARLLRALNLKITTVQRIYSTNPIEVRSEYAEMRLMHQKKNFYNFKDL